MRDLLAIGGGAGAPVPPTPASFEAEGPPGRRQRMGRLVVTRESWRGRSLALRHKYVYFIRMHFDPEMMRDILKCVEDIPAGEVLNGTIDFEGRSQAEVNEHILLLLDDEYLVGTSRRDSKGFPCAFLVRGLTMKGHQFLASARNDTIWKKVVSEAKDKGQSVPVTVLTKLLEQAAARYFGLK